MGRPGETEYMPIDTT